MTSPSYRKRRRVYNEPGHAHFMTFSCYRRQPFLSKDRSRQWTIDAIQKAREQHAFHLWAYVIMPEHVHLLIWPTRPTDDVSDVLSTIKQSVSKTALSWVWKNAPAFLKQMEDRRPNGTVKHRFWLRGGGHDFNVVEPNKVAQKIDYIHFNPVKRRLCERIVDWQWSSALEYEKPGEGLLRVDRESLPRIVERTHT